MHGLPNLKIFILSTISCKIYFTLLRPSNILTDFDESCYAVLQLQELLQSL